MSSSKFKVGVVGATGMVGEEFLKLLSDRHFPIAELKLFASENSQGQTRLCQGRAWPVTTLHEGCFAGLDLVFFSSGDEVSREWAPKAVLSGAVAIDNSGAFRMDPDVALIVPEVNWGSLSHPRRPQIIANPNCSTIQLVVALKPWLDQFGLEQVRVATYQAISGAGRAAQDELVTQLKAVLKSNTNDLIPETQNLITQQQPATLAFNCIPQIGSFGADGFSSEERKIRLESRKILGASDLKITAWTVRIPALNVHSEAVWVTLKTKASREQLLEAWQKASGLEVLSAPAAYPQALKASGTDPVFVGRLHADPDDERTWMFWVVADNLRKGAALNGIQIAELWAKAI